jgi:protein involved in polysaccharide export with SLBB domain
MDLPAGPDYVIGPGDGLTINLSGGVSQRLQRVVDREGRVALPEVGAVEVAGRNLGDVQHLVRGILRSQFHDIEADVSLSRIRTVRVYVVGDVERPGAYDVSSLSTPLNALYLAGGPTSGGSLRLLEHYRGKQLLEKVDVYDLLLHGINGTMQRLEAGDTIQVPPLSGLVTVEGMVRRPAMYELNGEKSLAEVLQLAGGVLPTGTLRHVDVERVESHESRTMLRLDIPETNNQAQVTEALEDFKVQDGDKIKITPILPVREQNGLPGWICLAAGQVRLQRRHESDGSHQVLQGPVAGTLHNSRRDYPLGGARLHSGCARLQSGRRACRQRSGCGAQAVRHDSRVQQIRLRRSADYYD